MYLPSCSFMPVRRTLYSDPTLAAFVTSQLTLELLEKRNGLNIELSSTWNEDNRKQLNAEIKALKNNPKTEEEIDQELTKLAIYHLSTGNGLEIFQLAALILKNKIMLNI